MPKHYKMRKENDQKNLNYLKTLSDFVKILTCFSFFLTISNKGKSWLPWLTVCIARNSLKLCVEGTQVAGSGATTGAYSDTVTITGSWHHPCQLCKTFWKHVKNLPHLTTSDFQQIRTQRSVRPNAWLFWKNQNSCLRWFFVEILFLG